MAETSGFWTTSGTPSGHQVSSYTQAIAAKAWAILAACAGKEGVAPGYLNECAGSVPGANTARIATGGAVVDGLWYENGANVDVTIPSAVGGGNTRIDRIVLRCTWANFEVEITRIAGVDAASPVAPSITQTPGTTYDIMLYQALVNTSGTVTLTDERVWGMVDVDDTTIEHSAGELRAKDDGISNAKLRNSSALSVIGRSANSTGDPADIAAGSDGYILRRSGTSLGFGQIVAAGITDETITAAKIANRTRKFLVPAPNTDLYNGAALPDAATTNVFGSFYVPEDFVSDMIVDLIVLCASASGNAVLTNTVAYGALGQGLTTHVDLLATQVIAISNNQNQAVVQLTLTNAAKGDFCRCYATRTGGHGSDSLAATLYTIGWLVTYTADS